MNNTKIFEINPMYVKYRRMWKENRWQFSGDLVRLTIKLSKVGELDPIEQHQKDMMDRVIEENDGKWTEGYEYDDGILTKIKEAKRR